MHDRFELEDVGAGNMIGVYGSLPEALDQVRDLLEVNGHGYAADLSLARRSDRRLMEDAESSYDTNERKPKYKKLVEYIQDESFVIPLAPSPEFYVMRKRVQGFSSDGEANMSMRGVRLDG